MLSIVDNMKKVLFLLFFISSLTGYSQVIRFMAGIEKDLSAENQCEIIRKSLPGRKVLLYRRNESSRLIKDCYGDTTSIIILFSAGCKNSYNIIESVLCDVWIVEPHFSYGESVRKCIDIGFPRKRIILGSDKGRGLGISRGCRSTPKGLGHFDSLEWVCGLIRNGW